MLVPARFLRPSLLATALACLGASACLRTPTSSAAKALAEPTGAACTLPWLFFDLGLNTLVDTSHEDANQDAIQIYYMPGVLAYLTDLHAKGYHLGLLVDVPEAWGDTNAEKYDATKAYIKRGWIAPDAAHPLTGFDWTILDDTAVFFPRTDADRKANSSQYLFKKGLGAAGNCRAIHQAARAKEIALAKTAGMPAYQVGVPNRPYYLPESEFAAFLAQPPGP